MPLPPALPPAPCLLAFDTSTEHIALGVSVDAARHSRNAPGGAAASATLLPEVHALLAQAGLSLADLRAGANALGSLLDELNSGLHLEISGADGVRLSVRSP